MLHPDDGLIVEFLDGEFAPGARAELEAHLAGCGACGERVASARSAREEADELVALLGEPEARAGAGELPPALRRAPRRPIPWRTLGWAASLVLAAGLGYAGGAGFDGTTGPRDEGTPASRAVGQSDSRGVGRSDSRPMAEAPLERRSDGATDRLPGRPTDRLTDAEPGPPSRVAEEAAIRAGAVSGEFAAPAEAAARLDERAGFQAKALADAAEPTGRRAAENDAAPTSLDAAIRALGGSIRLLDGLEVKRVDITWLRMPDGDSAASVELAYADQAGRQILLRQSRTAERGAQLEAADEARRRAPAAQAVAPQAAVGRDRAEAPSVGDGKVEWTDPAGFRLLLRADADADSLARLRARVR